MAAGHAFVTTPHHDGERMLACNFVGTVGCHGSQKKSSFWCVVPGNPLYFYSRVLCNCVVLQTEGTRALHIRIVLHIQYGGVQGPASSGLRSNAPASPRF